MTGPHDDSPDPLTLDVPFTITAAHGGPLDTTAFAHGFHLGWIVAGLALAAHTSATCVRHTVPELLVPQLGLLADAHGFPSMGTTPIPTPADGGTGQWVSVELRRRGAH